MNRSCIRFFGYIFAGITSLMGRINNATAGQIGNTYYETIVNQVQAYGSRCRSIIQELCPGAYCNDFSVDGYECRGDGSGIICNSQWVFAYRNADYTDDMGVYASDSNSDGCHYTEYGMWNNFSHYEFDSCVFGSYITTSSIPSRIYNLSQMEQHCAPCSGLDYRDGQFITYDPSGALSSNFFSWYSLNTSNPNSQVGITTCRADQNYSAGELEFSDSSGHGTITIPISCTYVE